MAYDEKLADRIRKALAQYSGVTERKMMGGLSFMLRGHMCCGALRNDLVVRVGPQRYAEALARPNARPMDFTGRPLKGFVFVGPRGYKSAKDLITWVEQAVDFVSSLPDSPRGGLQI